MAGVIRLFEFLLLQHGGGVLEEPRFAPATVRIWRISNYEKGKEGADQNCGEENREPIWANSRFESGGSPNAFTANAFNGFRHSPVLYAYAKRDCKLGAYPACRPGSLRFRGAFRLLDDGHFLDRLNHFFAQTLTPDIAGK